jgi:hypothetical protein
VAGIKAVYFCPLSDKTSAGVITSASGAVTNVATFLSTGKKFYKFELEQGVGEANQKPTPNAPNGSFFVEQNVTITIPKQSAIITYYLKALALNDLMCIVSKEDGTHWLLGETNGMKMQPSENPFGKTMGDLNGFVLTFKAMEPNFANTVTSALLTALQVAA